MSGPVFRPVFRPPAFALSLPAVPIGDADEPGAAQAIEIAAMLGDSVVAVKHCIDPRGGKVSRLTWGVVAAAAACLIASFVAFTASVRTAADNRARLDAWTRLEHRPAVAFRPHDLGPAADWLAFGGFGLALVGASLGILRIRRERVSPMFRIGNAPGVELAVDDAPAAAFPVVAPSGDRFVFRFVPGAPGSDGELAVDGTTTPLGELAAAGRAHPSTEVPGAYAFAIPRGARIRVRAGRATLLVSAVSRPRRHALPPVAGPDRRTVAYVAGSLAVHLAIWALLQLVPPDAAGVTVDLPVLEPIAVALSATTVEDPVPPRADRSGDTAGDRGDPGPAMALPPGAAGEPGAVDHGHREAPRADTPPQLSRDAAIAEARRAGLLGNDQLLERIDMIADMPELASGFDTRSFSGPMYGAYAGQGPGAFGGGVTGIDGLGGGCGDALCSVVPGGGYATIHDGPGGGGNYGLPGRGPGNRVHYPSLPRIGKPDVVGAGYDKAVIRRYIRRAIDKIGYCYDKQLLVHPELGGELSIRFFIAPDGSVQRAAATGFDREVAACVAGVIQTIAFPRPGDGVGVEVHYPFQFHAPGR